MQIIIAKLLNRIFVLAAVVIVLLFVGIFAVNHFFPEYKNLYIGGFILSSIGITMAFRHIENSWDKNLVMKMAQEGKIALMNITGAKYCIPLRDTGFTSYRIFEFEGILYDGEHNPLKKIFHEKMNRTTENVPAGFVYVTYDPLNPKRIFIIPNALIGSLQNLASIVGAYEKDTALGIKYLDVHYNKGIVMRSFQDTVNAYKKDKKVKHE